jgi:hypothetical protein
MAMSGSRCRQWRSIVFGSPHHLNLRLVCTARTPARATLEVWSALPLFIQSLVPTSVLDNIFAVLDCSNRIYRVILLDPTGSQLEQVWAAMQVLFPRMKDLALRSKHETAPVDPSCRTIVAGDVHYSTRGTLGTGSLRHWHPPRFHLLFRLSRLPV